MSKLKQLQLDIAHLIDHLEDQEALVRMVLDVKTGGAKAMMREQNMRTVIDLRRIYGGKMDEAVSIILNSVEHSDNLTESGENHGISKED